MTQPDRAARLGMTILACAMLVIVLAAAGIFLLLKYAPAAPDVTHLSLAAGSPAGANGVVRRRFERRFMASAVLDLPPVPPHEDNPSLQVSFFQRDALIQGGVIRTPANKFRLAGFLAYAHAGGPQTQVRYYGTLAEGPHTVMLSGDEREIVFTIDGKILDRVPRATFLPDIGANDPWLMLGTAVGAPGNSAFGRISHIRIRNEYDRARTILPNCIVTTGGITMDRVRGALRLGGRYTPAAEFGAKVRELKTDEAIAKWVEADGLKGKSPEEIEAFNVERRRWHPEPGSESDAYFKQTLASVAPDRKDIETWFDLLDLDEGRPVPLATPV